MPTQGNETPKGRAVETTAVHGTFPYNARSAAAAPSSPSLGKTVPTPSSSSGFNLCAHPTKVLFPPDTWSLVSRAAPWDRARTPQSGGSAPSQVTLPPGRTREAKTDQDSKFKHFSRADENITSLLFTQLGSALAFKRSRRSIKIGGGEQDRRQLFGQRRAFFHGAETPCPRKVRRVQG